jgi:NADPH:quinone reductase-like Zn-dependent oxidoreductase
MSRAIFVTRRGGPEVLADRELPEPNPGPGEVAIRVMAAGVNFADLLGRMGLYPEAPPIPFVPGYEVAGTVTAAGEGVADFAPGDRVLALTRFAGYAESAVTLASMAFRIPDSVPFDEAAAFPVNYATADLALFRVGALIDGERVLIHGGAGGVGSAAVRLARRRDVTIFATAGSPEKVGFMRREGVHHPLDHHREDVRAAVLGATGGDGVHLVIDARGGRGLRESLGLLAPLGRVVAFGVSEMVVGPRRSILRVLRALIAIPKAKPVDLMMKNRGILGLNLLPLFGRADLAARFRSEVLPLLQSGEARPVIHARLPLTAAGAAEAHRLLHARANTGKIVLIREPSR